MTIEKKIVVAYFKIRNACRYIRRNYHLKREWYGYAICIGIVLGICLDINSAPLEYITPERAYAEAPRKTAIIEVRIDWTADRIAQEIREVFPENAEQMIRVAWCESRLNKDAQGPTDDHGVFQLHDPSHDLSGVDVYNPAENIRFAKKLYEQAGLIPWKASKPCWSR